MEKKVDMLVEKFLYFNHLKEEVTFKKKVKLHSKYKETETCGAKKKKNRGKKK